MEEAKKMKWEKIPLEEQETLINIDYYEQCARIYSTKKSVCRALARKIGKPDSEQYYGNQISSQEWTIPFNDKKRIKSAMRASNYISNHLINSQNKEN